MKYGWALAAALFVIAVFVVIHDYKRSPRCIRSHQELVYIPAQTTYIQIGKVRMPQFHAARNETREICDEYEVIK